MFAAALAKSASFHEAQSESGPHQPAKRYESASPSVIDRKTKRHDWLIGNLGAMVNLGARLPHSSGAGFRKLWLVTAYSVQGRLRTTYNRLRAMMLSQPSLMRSQGGTAFNRRGALIKLGKGKHSKTR